MFFNLFTILLLSAVLSGCSQTGHGPLPLTRKGLMKDFLFKVQKSDGINREEAIVVAQSQLVFLGKEKEFYIDRPSLESLDSEDWVVHFYPINKTLAETAEHKEIAIVINKANGLATVVKN